MKFQPGQACANCQFFQGKAGDVTAPCTIFRGNQVYAKGWCSAYALMRGVSPVAWQHINLFGSFEFSPQGSAIDIEILAAY